MSGSSQAGRGNSSTSTAMPSCCRPIVVEAGKGQHAASGAARGAARIGGEDTALASSTAQRPDISPLRVGALSGNSEQSIRIDLEGRVPSVRGPAVR
jgi:hypothetical protein